MNASDIQLLDAKMLLLRLTGESVVALWGLSVGDLRPLHSDKALWKLPGNAEPRLWCCLMAKAQLRSVKLDSVTERAGQSAKGEGL